MKQYLKYRPPFRKLPILLDREPIFPSSAEPVAAAILCELWLATDRAFESTLCQTRDRYARASVKNAVRKLQEHGWDIRVEPFWYDTAYWLREPFSSYQYRESKHALLSWFENRKHNCEEGEV